jgi:hypothetical protein
VSLYNLLHGENPIGAALLACLNLTMEDVGRYRDAWLERDIFFDNAVQFFRLDADTLKGTLDSVRTGESPQLMRGPLGSNEHRKSGRRRG